MMLEKRKMSVMIRMKITKQREKGERKQDCETKNQTLYQLFQRGVTASAWT